MQDAAPGSLGAGGRSASGRILGVPAGGAEAGPAYSGSGRPRVSGMNHGTTRPIT